MRKMRFWPLFCAAALLCFSEGWSQSGTGGNTGLAFLKFGIGGHASAMGEAFTAVVNDAYATVWNPASLTNLDKAQAVFTHTEWLQDVQNEFFAFAFPAFGGGVGFSLFTNSVDGIERRTTASEQPLGSVGANDVALGISYGKQFSGNIQAGVTVKYLYEKIFLASSSGFALDLGLNYQEEGSPLRLAVVLQNIGSVNELDRETIDLPTTIRGGVRYAFALQDFESSLVVAVDGVKTIDTDFHTNFGAEFIFKQKIALRAGYQTGFDQKSFGGGLGLTFRRYQLDYGYTPFDSSFGDTHRFSFAVSF